MEVKNIYSLAFRAERYSNRGDPKTWAKASIKLIDSESKGPDLSPALESQLQNEASWKQISFIIEEITRVLGIRFASPIDMESISIDLSKALYGDDCFFNTFRIEISTDFMRFEVYIPICRVGSVQVLANELTKQVLEGYFPKLAAEN